MTQELDALVIFDRGTKWVDAFPVRSRTADDVYNCFINFAGSQQTIKYCYSDDSKELQAALTQLKIPHDPSFPGRPRTNSVAERQVKEVIAGTRTLLIMAGLPSCFGHMQ